MALGSTQPLTEMSSRNLPGGKSRPALYGEISKWQGPNQTSSSFISTSRNVMCEPAKNVSTSTITMLLLLWLYSPLLGFCHFFSASWSYTKSVGVLARGMNPSQGLYLHTGQHKHRINAHNTDIHVLSGILTHDSSVRESEESSYIRQRGRCDRHYNSKSW
jgi:hypothetical protein